MPRLILILASILLTAPALAQLDLPARLPDLPARLPETPLDRTESLLDELDDRVLDELEGVRRDTLNTLLRANRDVLERGPRGSVILRGEIIALDPSGILLSQALQSGFAIIEDRTETALGIRYLRLEVPAGVSTQQALRLLRQYDPDGLFDYNHIYTRSGLAAGYTAQTEPELRDDISIGMIDAGVPGNAPGFASGQVSARAFRGETVVPHSHGLQVASILGAQNGVAPGARIIAADVYGGQPTGGSADTILRALGWMAEADVRVVNISIVGPANIALQAAVQRFVGQGRMIVAAVGNDGASADPLYPAAYPDVIAVTAIDARNRILPEAVQGDHVDFAARGMDMAWPTLAGDTAQVRGTSFASPIVAGLLALELSRGQSTHDAEATLVETAEDLGRRGRDRVYGYGAVGAGFFSTRQAELR